MSVDLWIWGAFVGLIAGFLLLDLFVFHRHAHAVSMREAAVWSAVWVALGLLFGGIVWGWKGGEAAGEYLAGYVVEKSLSLDNVFVFAMIFSYFAVPAAYQHRILFWGVVGAIAFRAVFIAVGAALLAAFHWVVYVFGALLLLTGVKMALKRETEVHPEHNPVLRLVRRLVPMTGEYAGQAFFVRQAGRWVATPLLAVLVVVETTDVMFAIDSIPAIFAITDDTFIVFTSNVFAILGLRALYFLVAGMIGRFVYLQVGLGAILVLAGAKLLLSDFYKVPVWASLGAIVLTLVVTIAASLWASRRTTPADVTNNRAAPIG